MINQETENKKAFDVKAVGTRLRSANVEAAQTASEIEGGKFVNTQLTNVIKEVLPVEYKHLADHPLATVLLANVLAASIYSVAPNNKKLSLIAKALTLHATTHAAASLGVADTLSKLIDYLLPDVSTYFDKQEVTDDSY